MDKLLQPMIRRCWWIFQKLSTSNIPYHLCVWLWYACVCVSHTLNVQCVLFICALHILLRLFFYLKPGIYRAYYFGLSQYRITEFMFYLLFWAVTNSQPFLVIHYSYHMSASEYPVDSTRKRSLLQGNHWKNPCKYKIINWL